MDWWELRKEEPHSIEKQIALMLFNDLVYRSMVSVRVSVSEDIALSARQFALMALVDQGYLVSQVLSITKLLDSRRDVLSVQRLLRDVEDNSKLITREIYVAGDGAPYEYESALQVLAVSSGDVGLWGGANLTLLLSLARNACKEAT